MTADNASRQWYDNSLCVLCRLMSNSAFSHAGAFAYLKQLTGAQIAILQEDVGLIEAITS